MGSSNLEMALELLNLTIVGSFFYNKKSPIKVIF